jgi:hypothetical protein
VQLVCGTSLEPITCNEAEYHAALYGLKVRNLRL